jgi:hypothetical protein
LDLPACERWKGPLEDTIRLVGTAPFYDYYRAVLQGLERAYPSTLAFYRQHIREFEAAYGNVIPDSLAEIHCLADALRTAAHSDEERSIFGREQVLLVQMHMQIGNIGVPRLGECTSVVVRRPDGGIAHFRNWDFGPLPGVLGTLSVEIDFFFGSSGRQGFRCLLALTHIDKWTTCMKPGEFSMSLNAREFGRGFERGRPPSEELALFQKGKLPRVAVLQAVMKAETFDGALAAAATADTLTSMYVILAGRGEGAVVTLFGNATSSDVLSLPAGSKDWYLVQTNVDHWEPTSDNHISSHRRDHVKALLEGLNPETPTHELYQLLQNESVFPADNKGADDGRIFRPSTIASVLMDPTADMLSSHSWHADVWKQELPRFEQQLVLV